MTIKTIIFDFGGVLYQTPDLKWMKRWKGLLGIGDNPEILQMLENPNESQIVKDICLGKISEEHTWDIIAEKWHIKPDFIQRIRQKAYSKRNLNKPLVNFLAELHETYQTGILSNAGYQTRHMMEDIFHLDRYVENIIISAEEGVIKPDPRIYQIALERLSADPERTVFIDDYFPNIKAARDLGMKTVHFINNKQAIPRIQSHLNGKGG